MLCSNALTILCISCILVSPPLKEHTNEVMVLFDCRALEMSLLYCGWTKYKRPYTQPTGMKRRLSQVCTQCLNSVSRTTLTKVNLDQLIIVIRREHQALDSSIQRMQILDHRVYRTWWAHYSSKVKVISCSSCHSATAPHY